LAKNWLQENNPGKVQLSAAVPAGRYKYSSRKNNELLFIN
jgi:uncharacterized membrane protein